MQDNFDKWVDALKPENLKGNLISCALYIATFESFTDYIVEELKFFFNDGFSDDKFTFSPDYQIKVLSRNKSAVYATLSWFKEMEAIDDNDIDLFEVLKKFRNKLSHEMTSLVFDEGLHDFPHNFSKLLGLRVKIEKWWILNIEIPTGDMSDGNQDIEEDDIITSSQLFYKMVMDIVAGDEQTSSFYYKEFLKYREE